MRILLLRLASSGHLSKSENTLYGSGAKAGTSKQLTQIIDGGRGLVVWTPKIWFCVNRLRGPLRNVYEDRGYRALVPAMNFGSVKCPVENHSV